MMSEYELRSRCNAAGQTCKTSDLGCTCANPTDWVPPTDFSELNDHNGEDGFCVVCALSWLVIGLLLASFFMFIGNVLVDLMRRLS
jgi:hypothetical protein